MEAKRHLSMKDISGLFGVSAATVSKWRTRYAGTNHPCPEPTVWIGDPDDGGTPGWDNPTDWKAWKLALPGRGAGGGPLPIERAREEYRAARDASHREHPHDTTEWHHEVRALRHIAATYNVDDAALKELAGQIMEANPHLTNEEGDVQAVATVIRNVRGKKLAS
ncbi:hypothetical protein [Nonomuraea basaltis]|uniref:hypothetical protein n=1 Tax=Nonomuraea basaltis TaxID=2495887 RepID=UPI00110C5712|nr:hypothetical protein [Nonomuraea basaltis]TMS00195.1 hypothetical protein EJK15_03730 [Nonomuraea basaltis]